MGRWLLDILANNPMGFGLSTRIISTVRQRPSAGPPPVLEGCWFIFPGLTQYPAWGPEYGAKPFRIASSTPRRLPSGTVEHLSFHGVEDSGKRVHAFSKTPMAPMIGVCKHKPCVPKGSTAIGRPIPMEEKGRRRNRRLRQVNTPCLLSIPSAAA